MEQREQTASRTRRGWPLQGPECLMNEERVAKFSIQAEIGRRHEVVRSIQRRVLAGGQLAGLILTPATCCPATPPGQSFAPFHFRAITRGLLTPGPHFRRIRGKTRCKIPRGRFIEPSNPDDSSTHLTDSECTRSRRRPRTYLQLNPRFRIGPRQNFCPTISISPLQHPGLTKLLPECRPPSRRPPARPSRTSWPASTPSTSTSAYVMQQFLVLEAQTKC